MDSHVLETVLRSRRDQIRRSVPNIHKELCKQVHLKQYARFEVDFETFVTPLFERQIKSAAEALKRLDIPGKSVTPRQAADSLAAVIFNPDDWNEELINRALPVVAVTMSNAMKAQMLMEGVDEKKLKRLHIKGPSTATEWLVSSGADLLPDVVFQTPLGAVPMGFVTDYPPWMIRAIEDGLRDTFNQPYWAQVNLTTHADITRFLNQGLTEGWSIERMAREMAPHLFQQGKYALQRGRTIAKTEAANALNSARKRAIDQLIQDTGLQSSLKVEWMSVLGDTTRDTHANLDGVPADVEGLWNLGGYPARWPGDTKLPAHERINCFPGHVQVSGSFNGGQRAWYEGPMVKLVTASGVRLSVTPNHPIATTSGWIPAGHLEVGSQVLAHRRKVDSTGFFNQEQYKPPTIQEVFEFFAVSGGVEICRAQMDDFYGDGQFFNSKIDVVRSHRILGDWEISEFCKVARKQNLFLSNISRLILEFCGGPFCRHALGVHHSPPPLPSCLQLFHTPTAGAPTVGLSLGTIPRLSARLHQIVADEPPSYSQLFSNSLYRKSLIKQAHDLWDQFLLSCKPSRSRSVSFPDTQLPKPSIDGFLTDSKPFTDFFERHPGLILRDDVVDIRRDWFSGHVYDLSTERGYFGVSDGASSVGIISRNCQCAVVTAFGLRDAQALQRIQEAEDRLLQMQNS